MSENKPLVIERVYDATTDRVWEALTNIELLKKWSPFFTDFKAEVGFETHFTLGKDKDHQYLHICKVTEVIPGKKLTYTWRYDGYAGDSFVTFELNSENNQTKLKFMHLITEPFTIGNADFSEESFIEGWTYTVEALKKFVEGKVNLNDDRQTEKDLIITRVFDAPRDLVWKAWTDNEMLMKWSSPNGFTSSFGEGDLRPGGTWRAGMKMTDKDQQFVMMGKYQEIKEPELLVFTHTWEDVADDPDYTTIVTVKLVENGSKTTMIFKQSGFKSAERRDSHRDGWDESFDKLTELFKS